MTQHLTDSSAFMSADHDRVLALVRCPPQVIATRPWKNAAELSGDQRDLRHNVYRVRFEDPEARVDAGQDIEFEATIDMGGVKLTDSDCQRDLLTAKLVVLEAIRGEVTNGNKSSFRVYAAFLDLVWIIRWRRALRVSRNETIDAVLFDLFAETVKRGGILALIPFEERLKAIKDAVLSGNRTWPVRHSRGQKYFSFSKVAAELGVSTSTLKHEPYRSSVFAAVMSTSNIRFMGKPPSHVNQTDIEGRKRLTTGRANALLHPWQILHDLSIAGRLDHDPLSFSPFESRRRIQVAQQIGREDEPRTKTIPPCQMLTLLDGAARWVLDFAPAILSILDDAENLKTYGRALWSERRKIYRKKIEGIIRKHFPPEKSLRLRIAPVVSFTVSRQPADGEISLEQAVGHLITAVAILIGAFGARRKKEILSLRVGCIDEDADGEPLLSTYIEKTIRDVDQIPVPECVRYAVKLLEDLSEAARIRTGENWLFKVERPLANGGPRGLIGIELSRTIDQFADTVGVPDLEDGTRWHFTAHQLRRAFAVYYYHGYRHASLDALSRFLRHFDPEKTRRYVTEVVRGALQRLREITDANAQLADDLERQGIAATQYRELAALAEAAAVDARGRAGDFEDERKGALINPMLEMHSGFDVPIGVGAERLYEDLEMLTENARRAVRITGRSNVPPAEEKVELVQRLRQFAVKRHLEPHPAGHSHCGCDRNNPAALAKALECDHGVAFRHNRRVIDGTVSAIEEVARAGATQGQRESAELKLAALRAGIAKAEAAVQSRPATSVANKRM
jgi:integrase